MADAEREQRPKKEQTSTGSRDGSGYETQDYVMTIENLSAYYGSFEALKDVNMNIERKKITALIGPSGVR